MKDIEFFEIVEVYQCFYTYNLTYENLYKSYYEELQLSKSIVNGFAIWRESLVDSYMIISSLY